MKDAFERYQFKPFTGSSHSWALSEIAPLNLPVGAAILDIGPGSGAFGKHFQSLGYQTIDAVEIDPATREHVRPWYRQVVSRVEDLPPLEGGYQLTLLLDVLEHMVDPFSFLRSLTSRVAPGGSILISVPNITHWSCRLLMLIGRLEYTDRGIMDRTHLHFFTRRHFNELLTHEPTLTKVSLSGSIPPLEFVLPEWFTRTKTFQIGSRAHAALAGIWPTLFGYQHLGHLRKRPGTTSGQ